MTANELIFGLNAVVYLTVFARVVAAARRPTRMHVDIALLFSVPAFLVVLGTLIRLGLAPAALRTPGLYTAFLLLLALLLFRLIDDFVIVRAWARHTIALACLTLAAALALAPQLNGLILTAFAVVALLVYGAAAFLRAARGANGITRRRPQTVAAPTVARCW